VEDRATKRRIYLSKKAVLLVLQAFAVLVCIGSPVIAVVLIWWLADRGFRPLHDLLVTGVSLDLPRLPVVVLVIFALLLAATRAGKRISEKRKSIPYVPPVAEQIAALPAENILLRGSNQPATAVGELLRAAKAGSDTEAEELPRPREED